MTEYPQHAKAKQRIFDLISSLNPDTVNLEFWYANPNNNSLDPTYDWKFDVYFEINGKGYAIEVDGKVGHSSKRAKEKRDFKIKYLKSKGIHLFAWPTSWIVGRKALPDSVFIDELHLNSIPKAKEWFNV